MGAKKMETAVVVQARRLQRIEFKKELSCAMTDAEVAEASAKHVGALDEMDRQRERLRALSKDIRECIADLKTDEHRWRDMLQSRLVNRLVPCSRVIDFADGEVVETREDTGEVLVRRKTTAEENQMVLVADAAQETVEIIYAQGPKLLGMPADVPPQGDGTAGAPAAPSGGSPRRDVIAVVSGELVAQAVEVFKLTKRASTASLQRRLKLSFVAACDVMAAMEREGILGPMDADGRREIIVDLDTWQPPAPMEHF